MTALLTDLYQLTMLEAYVREGMNDTAVFELFVRRLPPQRNFLVAAGLEQALQFLGTLAFDEQELDWLARQQAGFSPAFLDWLRRLRFTGDVDAMPEGTPFFADEPVLRVTAPLPQAQFVESRLINLLHFQSLIASKAARVVLAAPGKLLVDFGMRRAHGAEAAVLAARAAYIAGFAGTATLEAARRFGIPAFGTMAHSFVQAHASESAAFEAFVRARPRAPTLLIDTYDTERAAARVVDLERRLAAEGLHIGGVRIDSADLLAHARAVRDLLDAGGCTDATIFASGDLDEQRIAQLLHAAHRWTASGSAPRWTLLPMRPRWTPSTRSSRTRGWRDASAPKARPLGPAPSRCGASSRPTARCGATACSSPTSRARARRCCSP